MPAIERKITNLSGMTLLCKGNLFRVAEWSPALPHPQVSFRLQQELQNDFDIPFPSSLYAHLFSSRWWHFVQYQYFLECFQLEENRGGG